MPILAALMIRETIMLDARQLRCFVAVAEELSFSAAAARLRVAQPALTRTIKRLEERLGARLFDRSTRSVRLTPFGSAFLNEARGAVGQLERAERTARELLEGRFDVIRLGYMNFVTHDFLAPILSRFTASHPETRIDLQYMGTEQQREALLDGEIDVAFMLGPFVAPGIECRLLREEELMVVMPADHPLAGEERIGALDLRGVQLIMGTPALWSVYRRIIFSEFDRLGVSPVIAQEAPTPAAIFSLVSAGMGVTIFPRAAKLYYDDQLALRPFVMAGNPVSTICAWHSTKDNPVLAAFLKCVDIAV